ncbi:MAG: S26 family signal peptidase [bacterium]
MMKTASERIAFWGALFLLVLAIATFEARVVWAQTASVKYRVFLRADGVPKLGDYVNVTVRHPIIDPGKAVRLTKRVGCTAGQLFELRDGEDFCDGQSLGKVLSHTSRGQRLTAFAWSGPIPPGKMFVVGDRPNSFDSRYFGFVDLAGAQRLCPLF